MKNKTGISEDEGVSDEDLASEFMHRNCFHVISGDDKNRFEKIVSILAAEDIDKIILKRCE